MPGPLPPIPNVIEFLLRGTLPGEVWENQLFYQYSGVAPSASNLSTLANSMVNAWQANIQSLVVAPIALNSVVATDMASNTGAQGVFSEIVTGTRGDDTIPANAALLVSYPTPLRYRGGHARSYILCGGFADLQDPMNWKPAFVNLVQTSWNTFLASVVGSTAGSTTLTAHCAVRRHGKYLPNAGPPHYVLNNPIVLTLPGNSAVAHEQIASQKGRIGRRSK